MVLEGGAFEKYLGHKDGALMNGLVTPEKFPVPFTMGGYKKCGTKKRICT